jgi:hypothetical protein
MAGAKEILTCQSCPSSPVSEHASAEASGSLHGLLDDLSPAEARRVLEDQPREQGLLWIEQTVEPVVPEKTPLFMNSLLRRISLNEVNVMLKVSAAYGSLCGFVLAWGVRHHWRWWKVIDGRL